MTDWSHKKRGSMYKELGRGKLQISKETLAGLGLFHAERAALKLDMIEVVVYKAYSDDSIWVRTTSEFEDGRFEELK